MDSDQLSVIGRVKPLLIRRKSVAHTIANKVEAAYRRGDLFDKRIHLMNDWANYCYDLAADTQT
jgi:hypothetical protein